MMMTARYWATNQPGGVSGWREEEEKRQREGDDKVEITRRKVKLSIQVCRIPKHLSFPFYQIIFSNNHPILFL